MFHLTESNAVKLLVVTRPTNQYPKSVNSQTSVSRTIKKYINEDNLATCKHGSNCKIWRWRTNGVGCFSDKGLSCKGGVGG